MHLNGALLSPYALRTVELGRYRSRFWYHTDEAASGEAPCGGTMNLEMNEDAGTVVALREGRRGFRMSVWRSVRYLQR